jgi:ATP-binding cassette, subfamily B, bacterial PglK
MRQFFRELMFPFSKDQKVSFAVLIMLAITSMILVSVGVGMILPIVGIIVDDQIQNRFGFLRTIGENFGVSSRADLLLVAVLGFFIAILLKVWVGIKILIKQKDLTARIRVSITDRLFRHIISLPYSFHVTENSAKVLRNLTSDISSHCRSVEGVIIIFSEGLLVIALILLLAVVDPIGLAIIAGTVLGSGLVYFRVIQSRIGRWGKLFRKENALMVQHTQQALGGIKEIKILKREAFFEKMFKESVAKLVDYERRYAIADALPVNLLEALIAFGVVAVVLGANLQEKNLSEIAPVLALFMASAVRLGPSLSRIAGSFQTIRYNRAAMTALYERLLLGTKVPFELQANRADNRIVEKWSRLQIVSLDFSYPTRKNFSLKDINLDIQCGTALGILGESGSGKSTLVDILLGLNHEYTGSILVDRKEIRNIRQEWQGQIGYVPQSVYLVDDSVRRNIAFGVLPEKIDQSRLDLAIDRAQLRSFIEGLPEGADSIVGERGAQISGGQQQRIGIARALYRDPSILVLDEATSALDSETESEFMKTVVKMRGQITMIIIAHRVSTLRGCDHLIRLSQGKVIQEGSYKDLIKNS